MKYACLVYLEEAKLRTVPDTECAACGTDLKERGILVAAEALQPVQTGKTVRVRQGKPLVMDGPFTETKELLAGFYLIEAPDIDAAVAIAAKIPPAREGSIEVRPVRTLDV
jgi:hypothetical protein